MITEIVKKEIDFQKFKCRASAASMILSESRDFPRLTEAQGKRLDELEKRETLTDAMQKEMAKLLVNKENSTKINLSATCISYLMIEYSWVTQGMVSVTREIMDVPQLRKGTIVEPQSLALLSIVDEVFYLPNEDENGNRERIYNEYLSGEVDAYEGEAIMGANIIPDVKSIWDYPTFLSKIHEPLTKANDWQVKCYLDISKAPKGFIANCLIDTPEEIINGIKYKLLNKLNCVSEEDKKFKETWKILERSMRFGHIDPNKRVFKKDVTPMTVEEQTFLYDQVKYCRDWLCNFHESYQKLNK